MPSDKLLEEAKTLLGIEDDVEEEYTEIRPEILAYLGGIIDGEGCIKIDAPIKGGKIIHKLTIGCKMMDPQAVELLNLVFPGYHRQSGKGEFEWMLQAKSAYECLKQLRPYLLVKKYEALLGIMFQEECIKKRGKGTILTEKEIQRREQYREQMQAAKKSRRYTEECLKTSRSVLKVVEK